VSARSVGLKQHLRRRLFMLKTEVAAIIYSVIYTAVRVDEGKGSALARYIAAFIVDPGILCRGRRTVLE